LNNTFQLHEHKTGSFRSHIFLNVFLLDMYPTGRWAF